MLDVSKLDPIVLSVLKEHGWYEEREYDISDWLNVMSREGYVSFEYAEDILKSLGGIYVNFDGGREYKSPQFNFNPIYADGFFNLLSNFEAAAKEELYPIGEMVQAFAYVGKSKKIYWGAWREFHWIADSIEDYLNNLFDINTKSKLLYINPRADEELDALNNAFKEIVRSKYPHLKIE